MWKIRPHLHHPYPPISSSASKAGQEVSKPEDIDLSENIDVQGKPGTHDHHFNERVLFFAWKEFVKHLREYWERGEDIPLLLSG